MDAITKTIQNFPKLVSTLTAQPWQKIAKVIGMIAGEIIMGVGAYMACKKRLQKEHNNFNFDGTEQKVKEGITVHHLTLGTGKIISADKKTCNIEFQNHNNATLRIAFNVGEGASLKKLNSEEGCYMLSTNITNQEFDEFDPTKI